jgi:hypothetical protein
MGSAPVVKYRLGSVTAQVWANERHFNVTITKRYKDGEEWKETDSLGAGDLMNTIRVLQRCEEYISDQ